MVLEYVKITGYTKDTKCPYNDACRCTVKNCKRCGWNPVVAERRLEKLRKGKCK